MFTYWYQKVLSWWIILNYNDFIVYGERNMTCKYCGNIIADDSIYCAYCGNKLAEELDEEYTEEFADLETGKGSKLIDSAKEAIGEIAVDVMKTKVEPLVKKEIGKKAKSVTNKFLIKAKIKKKTPLDYVSDLIKQVSKKK